MTSSNHLATTEVEPSNKKRKPFYQHLTFWVLLAITLGIAFGHFFPAQAALTDIINKWFIAAVKYFVYPIVFLTIAQGIASMSDMKSLGKVGIKSLLYFEIVTTFALLVGIGVAWALQPGAGVVPLEGSDASKFRKSMSLLEFLQSNWTLDILIIAIVVGIVLCYFPRSMAEKKKILLMGMQKCLHWVFILLRWFMVVAPIAAFSGMATTIGKYGLSALWPLAKLMLSVYCTMGLFIVVILGLILRSCGISLWKFLYYLKDELLLVLGTSSSEPALPGLMRKLESMGCSKSIVGLVVPSGYSFNLDGTTLYLSMAVMFLAQVYHVQLSAEQIMTIILVLMATSKGAAGVTGSGLVVLASTLDVLEVIPIAGLSILNGVDRFMSEARAITNFIGNGVATVYISVSEKELDHAMAKRTLDGE